MATHVIGGIHDGASFMPTNGVEAHARVEVAIIRLRALGVKNPRGRYLDQENQRRVRRHTKKS